MEDRQIIQNAFFSPDELTAVEKAFDDAWVRLAPAIGSLPAAVLAARMKLADILVNLAAHGNFDPQWLADTALRIMVSRASRFQP